MYTIVDSKKSKLSKSPCGSDGVREKNSEACGKPVLSRQSLGASVEKGEEVATCKLEEECISDKMVVVDGKKCKTSEEDDYTATGETEGHETVEPDVVEDVPDCSPNHNHKVDLPSESNSGLSPLQQYVPLSPADQSSGGMVMCDSGGGEERSVGAVMSEEEEGALDSSMEELPLSPPPPISTTTITEGNYITIDYLHVQVCN